MSFRENVDSLLAACMDTFAQAVTYTDENFVLHCVEGVFSNEFEGVDPNTGFPVVSSIPNLGIKLNDWPQTPKEGESISINNVDYDIRHVEDDGEGGAVIFLDKVIT